jgi:transcriptional regulator with XRE-family HTH domain
MSAYNSHPANLSRFATCETTFSGEYGAIRLMQDSDEAVGRRIIALRKARGLQQQELAEAIGVAGNTLNGYELGKRPLTMESARRIRRRFGVTIDWLMFGDMGATARDLMLDLGPEPGRAKNAGLAKSGRLERSAKRARSRIPA